jgi:hypothetical protein
MGGREALVHVAIGCTDNDYVQRFALGPKLIAVRLQAV